MSANERRKSPATGVFEIHPVKSADKSFGVQGNIAGAVDLPEVRQIVSDFLERADELLAVGDFVWADGPADVLEGDEWFTFGERNLVDEQMPGKIFQVPKQYGERLLEVLQSAPGEINVAAVGAIAIAGEGQVRIVLRSGADLAGFDHLRHIAHLPVQSFRKLDVPLADVISDADAAAEVKNPGLGPENPGKPEDDRIINHPGRKYLLFIFVRLVRMVEALTTARRNIPASGFKGIIHTPVGKARAPITQEPAMMIGVAQSRCLRNSKASNIPKHNLTPWRRIWVR